MDVAAAQALASEGYSRRKIARMLGVSRNTLRKYLSEGTRPPPGGKLASYLDAVAAQLAERPEARAMDVFRRLKAEGYVGSYDLVKRKIRSLRKEGGQAGRNAEPGMRAVADLERVETSVGPCYLFTLTLEHSGRIYAELSEKPELDAFFDWHQRGFRFLGGIPAEIAYEKSRSRLLKAFVGGSGVHLPMARFASHFGFTPSVAPSTAPWSAGRLKRPIRMIEALFLKGYPFQSAEAANPALQGWLLGREPGDAEARDRLARDQAALLPLPKAPFEHVRPKLAVKGES
jgi:transposase